MMLVCGQVAGHKVPGQSASCVWDCVGAVFICGWVAGHEKVPGQSASCGWCVDMMFVCVGGWAAGHEKVPGQRQSENCGLGCVDVVFVRGRFADHEKVPGQSESCGWCVDAMFVCVGGLQAMRR